MIVPVCRPTVGTHRSHPTNGRHLPRPHIALGAVARPAVLPRERTRRRHVRRRVRPCCGWRRARGTDYL